MDFSIGELHPNTPHLFADLVELILITGCFRYERLHKNDLEGILQQEILSSEELDEEEISEASAKISELSSAEKNDRHELQLENVLILLDYRSISLRSYYPFKIEGEQIILEQNLTDKHRIYIFLLTCSRLRSFKQKGIRQRWAKSFTELCKIAMGGMLPHYASVRIFDANSQDRKDYYNTDLRLALVKLGEDLGVIRVVHEECNQVSHAGDAGFDLVATINFEDNACTSYAMLGQCGAQEKNWPTKTLEAHPIKFRHLFHYNFDYPSVMFTPVSYRKATGEWVHNGSSNGILLLDRLRILKLIDFQNRWTEITNTSWFIEFETELKSAITPD